MGKTLSNVLRPAYPGWDVAVTRIWQEVSRRVDVCLEELALRLDAVGLISELQVRVGPRGVSSVLCTGTATRGLFELEYSLVDGMLVSRRPGALLEVRLLDADGHALAECSPPAPFGLIPYLCSAEQIIAASGECLSVAAVHAVITDHYDLLHRRLRDLPAR